LSEFEELLEKIQEQKPELTKQDIDDRVKQKIEKIGPGYLTDEGALFLIAKDLGISLKQTLKTEMSLKDIYVGAKDVSIESRVLNISPTKQFSRKDGSPTYQLSAVVDDHLMNITHVIRGDDHKINSFKQKQIYEAMNWKIPEFAHIPLIHSEFGSKLSKRDKASTIDDYIKLGIISDALRNYLLRLVGLTKIKKYFLWMRVLSYLI